MNRRILIWAAWGGLTASLFIFTFFAIFLLPSNRVIYELESIFDLEYIFLLFFIGVLANLLIRDVRFLLLSISIFGVTSISIHPTLISILLTIFYCFCMVVIVQYMKKIRSMV